MQIMNKKIEEHLVCNSYSSYKNSYNIYARVKNFFHQNTIENLTFDDCTAQSSKQVWALCSETRALREADIL